MRARPLSLRLILFALFATTAALPVHKANAHDPGLSAATIVLDPPRITATFRLDAIDVPADPLRAASLLEAPLALVASGRRLSLGATRTTRIGDDHVRVELDGVVGRAETLQVHARLLERLPFGHRQYLRVLGPDGGLIGEAVLDAKHPRLEVRIADDPPGMAHFVALGFEHILEGWDHLLFLFVMLLACRSPAQIFQVITAFTLAHSATLALATVGGLRFDPALVEPAIAASIVFAAIRSFRSKAGERIGLTFGFGLIHGLGFAGQLAGLGLEQGGLEVVRPLLGFNLGVELGQLLVAIAVVPVLVYLRRLRGFTRVGEPVASIACGLVGLVWLAERIQSI